MQPSSYSDIVRRLRELGPFGDEGVAAGVLRATLKALGGVLGSDERESLCRALPPELAAFVRRPSSWRPRRTRELFPDVAAHAGIGIGFAIEYGEIVCRVLGEILTPSARARLACALPEISELIQPITDAPPPFRLDIGPERDCRSDRPPESCEPHSETGRSAACSLAAEREARTLSRVRHSAAGGRNR